MRFDWMIHANSLNDWLLAVAVAVAFYFFAFLFKRLVRHKVAVLVSETATAWDDLMVEMVGRIHSLFVLILAVYIGTLTLSLPSKVETALNLIGGIAVALAMQNILGDLFAFPTLTLFFEHTPATPNGETMNLGQASYHKVLDTPTVYASYKKRAGISSWSKTQSVVNCAPLPPLDGLRP